jgi:hypothetical protein
MYSSLISFYSSLFSLLYYSSLILTCYFVFFLTHLSVYSVVEGHLAVLLRTITYFWSPFLHFFRRPVLQSVFPNTSLQQSLASCIYRAALILICVVQRLRLAPSKRPNGVGLPPLTRRRTQIQFPKRRVFELFRIPDDGQSPKIWRFIEVTALLDLVHWLVFWSRGIQPFSVRVPPDVISLQLCTLKVVGV